MIKRIKAGVDLKRQRMEIMTQILALCARGAKKTRIMYQTNLSYEQLKSYLMLLTSQNLLESNSDGFITTEKGYRFLEAFARLNDVLKEDSHDASEAVFSERYREVQIIRVREKTVSCELNTFHVLRKPQNKVQRETAE